MILRNPPSLKNIWTVLYQSINDQVVWAWHRSLADHSLSLMMNTSDVQTINHHEFCGHRATLYMQAVICPSFFLFKLILNVDAVTNGVSSRVSGGGAPSSEESQGRGPGACPAPPPTTPGQNMSGGDKNPPDEELWETPAGSEYENEPGLTINNSSQPQLPNFGNSNLRTFSHIFSTSTWQIKQQEYKRPSLHDTCVTWGARGCRGCCDVDAMTPSSPGGWPHDQWSPMSGVCVMRRAG